MKKMKEKLKKNKTLILIIAIIIFTILLVGLISSHKVKIKIIGEQNIVINYKDNYKDKGAKVEVCTLFKCKDISSKIEIINKVNTEKIGNYEVIYKFKYKNKNYETKRKIAVKEKEPPQIILNGAEEVLVCPTKKYQEEGFEAKDNYDGDITNKVITDITDESITYSVSDSSNNKTSVIRKIKYGDEEKPTITLKGYSRISLNVGENYQESGYTVEDNCDDSLDSKVKITNNIDSNKIGTYYVNYEVEDSNGNKATATRTVVVYGFQTQDKDIYSATLTEYIKNQGYNISVGYYNLQTGYTYTYRPSTVYYGASLIKTLDALYIYNNASNGNINLDDTKTYESKYIHGYSAEMANKSIGEEVKLRDLVKYAITVSDNSAHVMLVDYIGFDNLKSYGNSLGATYALSGSDKYGSTTVYDQIAYWKAVYQMVNNTTYGSEVKSYFINGYANDLAFSGGPTIMHKFGDYNQSHHDAGIALTNSPYIIVVLTSEGYRNYSSIINDISQKVYNLNKLE